MCWQDFQGSLYKETQWKKCIIKKKNILIVPEKIFFLFGKMRMSKLHCRREKKTFYNINNQLVLVVSFYFFFIKRISLFQYLSRLENWKRKCRLLVNTIIFVLSENTNKWQFYSMYFYLYIHSWRRQTYSLFSIHKRIE